MGESCRSLLACCEIEVQGERERNGSDIGWLSVVINLSNTKARNRVPHKFFFNKRCRREFGNWYMNGAVEPPRSLFPKLPFEGVPGGNVAKFSTVELVSLPGSLSGCPRLCDVVPESLRRYLDNIRSMIESQTEYENMQPLLAAYGDPVLKRNRAKRMMLFARLLGILRNMFSESSLLTSRTRNRNVYHVEEGSPTWESDLESIELSLGMGDIQD